MAFHPGRGPAVKGGPETPIRSGRIEGLPLRRRNGNRGNVARLCCSPKSGRAVARMLLPSQKTPDLFAPHFVRFQFIHAMKQCLQESKASIIWQAWQKIFSQRVVWLARKR